MAKQVAKGPGQIGIPTRVQTPVSVLDQPDYDIHRDPDLASRSAEFLEKYLGQLDDQDMTILGDLTYGQHGGYFSDEEYKRAMLADGEVYQRLQLGDSDIEFRVKGGNNPYVKIKNPITGKTEEYSIAQLNEKFGTNYSNKEAVDIVMNKKGSEFSSELAQRLNEGFILDKGSGGFVDTKDKSLQESYFGKTSQGAGVKSMYKRAKAAGQADAFSERLTGSEGYSSMVKKMAEANSFGMMEGYQDAMTTAGSAFTNTLDSQSINALINEDEFRLGL